MVKLMSYELNLLFYFRKRTADKEYIEYFECEQVMAEELFDQYKGVERIVAHQVKTNQNLIFLQNIFLLMTY